MTSIDDSINTVLGSFMVLGGVICMWCCVYRCAQNRVIQERHIYMINGDNLIH